MIETLSSIVSVWSWFILLTQSYACRGFVASAVLSRKGCVRFEVTAPATTTTTATVIFGVQGHNVILNGDSNEYHDSGLELFGDAWNIYRSNLLHSESMWRDFMNRTEKHQGRDCIHPYTTAKSSISMLCRCDPFWEQIKLEATHALEKEPEVGPKLYQNILLQPSLMEAVASVLACEIETELILAPALKALFLEQLMVEDQRKIRMDLEAAAVRSPCIHSSAMDALLFHSGFHALVCHRVAHQLWKADRTALAYYLQSTMSRMYGADIHPAAVLGGGIYLRIGVGVVIGETAVVGDDCCILEGVTLGGTGKDAGDRHPKIGHGVILQEGGAVLGNIEVGEGALVMAKSIVTKPVPPLAIVSGVPAHIRCTRNLTISEFDDDVQRHLIDKYLQIWKTKYASAKA